MLNLESQHPGIQRYATCITLRSFAAGVDPIKAQRVEYLCAATHKAGDDRAAYSGSLRSAALRMALRSVALAYKPPYRLRKSRRRQVGVWPTRSSPVGCPVRLMPSTR